MIELVAFRCAAWDTPFWLDANPLEGRYNRAGEAPTTYLGLHPLTPWAEILRANPSAEIAELRPPTWVARVRLDPADVVELSFDDPGPLSAEALVDDDFTACQEFAAELRADPAGPQAIVAPSAALPGTRNLILLGPRVLAPYLAEPVDPSVDAPAAVTSVRGQAPLRLSDLVHHRGRTEPHAGLAAWRAGEAFELIEPDLRGSEVAGAR